MYFLKKGTLIDEKTRLQITVWEHSKGLISHNDCVGGLSLSLSDLNGAPKIGWFGLLPESFGRGEHQFLGNTEDIDPAVIPDPVALADIKDSPEKDSGDDISPSSNMMPEPTLRRQGSVTTQADMFAARFEKSSSGGELINTEITASEGDVPTSSLVDDNSTVEEEFCDPPGMNQRGRSASISSRGSHSNLTRSGSQESLASMASLAPDQVESAAVITGALELEVSCELLPGCEPSATGTCAVNTMQVTVKCGAELATKDPYVKLYLSKDGKDVKGTKKKTSRRRPDATGEVTINQTFVFDVKSDTAGEYRLQIAVWDHSRLKPNTCAGGFSFPLAELAAKAIRGWFALLPFHEGRESYVDPTESPPIAAAVSAAADSRAQIRPGRGRALPTIDVSQNMPEPIVVSSSTESELNQGLLSDQNTNLKRSGSETSLASVASATIVSHGQVEGDLNLYAYFEPAAEHQQEKLSGFVHLTVNEGRKLSAADPYVKIYLSVDGKNIKTSKQKTKVQRKTRDPVYQEQFVFKVPADTPLDATTRLQITVWCNSRMKANECHGGMSFSMTELKANTRTSGWYRLLPYLEGRTSNISAEQTAFGLAAAQGHSAVAPPDLARQLISESSGDGGLLLQEPNPTANKPKSGGFFGGLGKGKKEAIKLTQDLRSSTEREERHIIEKAALEEKVQAYREQVSQMAELQSRNLRLQNELADARGMVERCGQLEVENTRLADEIDSLELEKLRLDEFVTLHKEDADQRRDQIVVLRDCLSDLKDENRGLRSFQETLTRELLALDKKAFERAVGIYSSSMV